MPKHYKEMMDEIINKMDEGLVKPSDEKKLYMRYKKMGMNDDAAREAAAAAVNEDAPTNAVAHGGVDMNPTGKKKKKDEVPAKLMDVIMKRMSGKIKEDNDNNNVVLKGVLDKLDKLDEAIDRASGIVKEKVEFVEDKEYKGFKTKYDKKL
jgi:hypothetical protein